jgi:hypothetical protein
VVTERFLKNNLVLFTDDFFNRGSFSGNIKKA